MSAFICKKEGITLVAPFNTWDTNYHLYDGEGNDYLIDCGDVRDSLEEIEEYGGVLWEDLRNLNDVENIKECAWKVDKVDAENSLQFWDILSAI